MIKRLYICTDGLQFDDEDKAKIHEEEIIKYDPLFKFINDQGNLFYDDDSASDYSETFYHFIKDNAEAIKKLL